MIDITLYAWLGKDNSSQDIKYLAHGEYYI